MPEPLLYFQATVATAIASATVVLAIIGWRRAGRSWLSSICVVGLAVGLAVGYWTLALQLAWPPRSGLDRLLLIVMPATLAIELIAVVPRLPDWAAWLLRLGLVASLPRILLHGSVYLIGSDDGTWWHIGVTWIVSMVLLSAAWILLLRLFQSRGGVSIPLALSMAIQSAGVTVMMAGYIKGGAAAIPFVAAICGVTLVANWIAKRRHGAVHFDAAAVIAVGVVGLFGLLFIGHFFGRISVGSAVTLLLAPLLCWTTETRLFRDRKPLLVGSFRLLVVAIPLIVVLWIAKREFDREMIPLMGQRSVVPKMPVAIPLVQPRAQFGDRTRPSTQSSPAVSARIPS